MSDMESSAASHQSTPADERGEGRSLSSVVSRLASLILHGGGVLSTGDIAALRRMDPRRIDASGFYKLEVAVLADELPSSASSAAREGLASRWAAIVVGLAHLGKLHRGGESLGSALSAARFSELRFVRLIRADADRLLDEIPALGRFLAAKGVATDFTAAARLMLSAGRKDEETTRRLLARDYYGALERAKNNHG